MKNNNKKKEIDLFRVDSLYTYIVCICIFTAIESLFIYLYNFISPYAWYILLAFIIAIIIILVFGYLKPTKSFKSKALLYFDVFLITGAISLFNTGILSIPTFNLIVPQKWIFHVIIECLSLLFLLIVCIRFTIIFSNDIKAKEPVTLVTLMNGQFPENIKDCIITDVAINEDIFDRDILINDIYSHLTTYSSYVSSVVGVVGDWGTGKTSCLSITLNKIRDTNNNFIICDKFKSWCYDDKRSIMVSMLAEIYKSLDVGVMGTTIHEKINLYANTFLKDSKIPFLSGLVLGKVSDDSIINVIGDYLTKHNKRLIFLVDDLDRLSKDIVDFIFKVVFDLKQAIQNITFVCVYSDKIFEEPLKISRLYVEKIIDETIEITNVDKGKIYNIIVTCIREYDKKYNTDMFSEIPPSDLKIIENISTEINTPRAIIRLLNSFFRKYDINLKLKLNFIDKIAIDFIRINNPELFYLILSESYMFVCVDTLKVGGGFLLFKNLDEKKSVKKEFYEKYFTKGKKFASYEPLIKSLFPGVDPDCVYDSSKEFADNANLNHRIYSGRYFYNYVLNKESSYGRMHSTIRSIFKNSPDYTSFENQIFTLLSLFTKVEQKIVLGEIDLLAKEAKDQAVYSNLFKYIINHYTDFTTIINDIGLSTRSMAFEILSSASNTLQLEDFRTIVSGLDINHYVPLCYLYNSFSSNEESRDNNKEILTILNKKLKDLDSQIDSKHINLLDSKHYNHFNLVYYLVRNKDVASSYLELNLNENTVYAFVSEFIRQAISTGDEPFILKLDMSSIEKYIPFEKIVGLINASKEINQNQLMIKDFVMEIDSQIKNKGDCEKRYHYEPYFIEYPYKKVILSPQFQSENN